jgi:hypothetical protein
VTSTATAAPGNASGQTATAAAQAATAPPQATATTAPATATAQPPTATAAPQTAITRDNLVGTWVVETSTGGSLAPNGTIEFRQNSTAVVSDRPASGSTRTAIGQYELLANNQLRLILGFGDAIQTFNVTLSGANLTLENDRYKVTLRRQ